MIILDRESLSVHRMGSSFCMLKAEIKSNQKKVVGGRHERISFPDLGIWLWLDRCSGTTRHVLTEEQ